MPAEVFALCPSLKQNLIAHLCSTLRSVIFRTHYQYMFHENDRYGKSNGSWKFKLALKAYQMLIVLRTRKKHVFKIAAHRQSPVRIWLIQTALYGYLLCYTVRNQLQLEYAKQ